MSRRQREGAFIGKWRGRFRRSKHLVMGDRVMPMESMRVESDWIVPRKVRRAERYRTSFGYYDYNDYDDF